MLLKSYSETVNWLFAQFPAYQNLGASAYKTGLENTHKLHEHFGRPADELKFVHIAGSNGKGSCSSMLASSFTEAGYKTGLFTSPHLLDFRERIRINGVMIEEEFVISFCNEVQALELDFSPSFFEVTWIMALLYFKKEQMEVCIIETGLGGRLDSTNIIQPELSVITNISIEHSNFLGDTIEKIAFEKGGIIKPNTPLVVGRFQAASDEVFLELVRERKASVFYARNFSSKVPDNLFLRADYQKENYKTCSASIQILQGKFKNLNIEHLENGLENLHKNTGFAGRLQTVSENPRIIIDVSHNEDGILQTLAVFRKEISNKSLKIIYGSSSDKGVKNILKLFPKSCRLYLTSFENERAISAEKLKNEADNLGLKSSSFTHVKEALASVKAESSPDDTILICGSFFLIHDFLKFF
jgi:dihydrofolate synthase/folylpolyglutamate synthase